MQKIELNSNVDLSGKQQRAFKKIKKLYPLPSTSIPYSKSTEWVLLNSAQNSAQNLCVLTPFFNYNLMILKESLIVLNDYVAY